MEQKFEVAFPHSVFGVQFYRAVNLVAMNQLDIFIQCLMYVLHSPRAVLAIGWLQWLVTFLPDLP